VAAAQAEIDLCHEALTTKREQRTTRTDQLLFLNALQYEQALLQRLKEELARVERELEVRRQAMVAAQRKLEALERLKTRQKEAHRVSAQRREEAMIDDLIGARFAMHAEEVAT
jgi:flagellar export protein FliJ